MNNRLKYCSLILLLLFFCGCSNEVENPGEVPKTVIPVPARKHYVAITEMKFKPEVLKVRKGDSIVFANLDIVDHDVTEAKTKAWSSPVIPAGAEWAMVAAASTDYYCSIHVVMKGTILVE